MPRYVYDFHEGDRDQKPLLGGKGANLAEMTTLGLPVPPAFTIITEACRAYLAQCVEPAGLRAEVDAHLAALERRMGARWARATIRCWSACGPGRSTRCPG